MRNVKEFTISLNQTILPFLLLLLMGSCPRFAAAAQSGCSTKGAPAAEIPFTLIGDHIYTEATVNGSGPYRFIVDTGGVNLIDSSLVAPLSLKINGSEAGHGTGPESVETGKTTVDRLTVGGITFTRQPFFTFDFGQLYAGGGVKMLGMVGAQPFRDYVTCFDFGHQVIDLIEPGKFDPKKAGAELPMSINESEILVRGSFDGIPATFQIDTGSPTTLTLAAPFVTKHELLNRFPKHLETSSGGVGGSSREYNVRGKDLVLGTERIPHPITALAAVSKGQLAKSEFSGIVGVGALKRYVVTFDFSEKRLFLKTYEPVPADLDQYDRSGMRIEADPAGFRVVSVSKGTPADQAGLHAGDLIVAVDGRSTSSISLPDMRDKLKNGLPGSVIALSIKSENVPRTVRLELRNLL